MRKKADDMTWEGLNPPYRTIVVDPPWQYEGFPGSIGRGGHFAKGPRQQVQVKPLPYRSMPVYEMELLPVGELAARDSWLWLWTTTRYLPDAFKLIAAWEFRYRQLLVWRKTGNPSPFGGTVAPPHAEFLLLAARADARVKGRIPSPVFDAPKQGSHSQKPAAFLDLIETATPGPYVELFARRQRLGWDSWGFGYEGAA